ncbi:MAG: LLM class flavin-dependent oxidoreductase [Nitrososphaerales archaeon]
MKFGILLPLSGPHGGVSEILSTALHAEEMDFDSVWSYDLQLSGGAAYRQHVVCGSIEDIDPKKPPVFYEPLTTLAYIAAKTTRISIGTGVVILPLANPFTVAKQAANLDVLSGGRFILGVGIGSKSPYSKMAFDSFNVPFEERGNIHDEYLRAIISLWKEPRTNISGRFVKLKDVELYPKPTRPRIWVAARGGPGFKRVAELGDGWFPANFAAKEIASGITRVREEREEIGRGGNFDVASMNYICLARDKASAIEQSKQTLMPRVEGGSYGRARNVNDAYDRCFLGNAKDIAAQLEEYARAGVTHNVFTVLFKGNIERLYADMKLMATEIFPSFR